MTGQESLIQARRHGIASRYRGGCRCDQCRQWMREYQRVYRAGVRKERPTGLQVHGLHGYIHHGCRCDVCRAANAKAQREYRARKKARAK